MSSASIAKTLERHAAQIGALAPCYLYDETMVRQHVEALKRALPQADILYSVKANNCAPLLRMLAALGLGADAASAREVELAAAAGIKPADIYYSAPGKSAGDIARTLGRATIIADSLNELARIEAVAAASEVAKDKPIAVGVRCTPDFDLVGYCKKPSKFGIPFSDVEKMVELLKACPHIRVTGLHMHLQSQCLDAAAIAAYYNRACSFFADVFSHLGTKAQFLNLGSGIGVAYNTTRDAPFDLSGLGEALSRAVASYENLHEARVLIESGRYIVCEAGTYVTQVLDVKHCYGKTYVIVQNGANGFLRPVYATLAMDNNAKATVQEPFFTAPECFAFHAFDSCGRPRQGKELAVELVGNLCTACDTLGHDAKLPADIAVRDLITISNAGSYARNLSALAFASQQPPREALVRTDGSLLWAP